MNNYMAVTDNIIEQEADKVRWFSNFRVSENCPVLLFCEFESGFDLRIRIPMPLPNFKAQLQVYLK